METMSGPKCVIRKVRSVRHPQVALLGVLDLLDGGGGDDRVAGWEDAVQGAVRPAAGLGARVHTDLADDEAHAGAGEASRRGVGRVSVSRLTLRGNWAACPTVIGPFVCEGVVGGRVPVVRCLRVLCGRTWRRAVVLGDAWSYPGARGRTRGRVVVPGVAWSYLRAPLRYDHVELRTTVCGRGTTARFYVRPGGTAYDRTGPMAHGDEPVRAPGRSGLCRPASRRSAVRGCGACGMQQDSCRCAYPLAARGERPGLGSFGRGVPEPVAKESSAGIDGRGKPVIPTTSPVRFDWIRSPGHRAGGRLVGGGACGPGARGPHDRLVVARGVALLVEDRPVAAASAVSRRRKAGACARRCGRKAVLRALTSGTPLSTAICAMRWPVPPRSRVSRRRRMRGRRWTAP